MASYPHGFRDIGGRSAHAALVGLALETDDHAAGVLCGAATLDAANLVLDDATTFESGQPPGQLSAGRANRLANGLLGASADIQTVISYMNLAAGTATLPQTQAGLQAFMRVVRRLLT